jgi:hypothetical protein
MQDPQKMMQGGSLGRGHRSYNTVCQGHHTQLGPLFSEFVSRRLQGCARSRNIISLFMDDHLDSHYGMKGAEVCSLCH